MLNEYVKIKTRMFTLFEMYLSFAALQIIYNTNAAYSVFSEEVQKAAPATRAKESYKLLHI